MKKVGLFFFLILLSSILVKAQSSLYFITVDVSGGLAGINCNGAGSFVSITLDTGPGTPILATNRSSGTNSFQDTQITYSSLSPLGIPFRLMASGSARCPGVNESDTWTQFFTLNAGNIAATCGIFANYSGSNPAYRLNARVFVTQPLRVAPVATNPGECGTTVNISINDTESLYDWEVSETGLSSSFVHFRTAPGSITASVNQLSPPGFTTSKYSNRFVRVRGRDCNRARISPISAAIKFNVEAPTAVISNTDPICTGEPTGTINVAITSADPLLVNDFVISLFLDPVTAGSIPIQQSNIIDSFSDSFHNVGAGDYTVRIQNNSGSINGSCFNEFDAKLFDPPAVTAQQLGVVSVSCNSGNAGPQNDGLIQLQITGTPPFTYQTSKDGAPFIAITADNASTFTPTFSALPIGGHRFIVTDSKGCESPESATIFVLEPTTLIAILDSKVDNFCLAKNRGEIDVTTSGGNGGYTYAWSATGTYAPYSIPPVEDPTNLFAGDYSLTVTDAKGCANAIPLTTTVTEPALPLIVNATVPSRSLYGGFDMTCALNDGIIELDLENETLPVASYTWTKDGNPFTPTSFTFAEDLTPGVYDVTVIDGNNCDAAQSITLNPHPGIIGITRATSSFNGFNTKCPDSNEGEGFVESVTNAFGTLSYTWFDGSTNQSIADLLPGNYAVNVIDGNGCSDDATLVIAPPPAIDPNIQITSNYNGESITCPGAMDGAMEAFPTNGFGSYSYLWDHGPTSAAISGLSQDTYAVTVTDDYGCSVRNELLISDPATMQLPLTKTSYNGSDLTCREAIDGGIQLNVVNGIAPYAYTWSEGSTSQNISGLAAGDYSVTVTDQNGCTQTNSTTIINPDALLVDMQHVNDFNGFDISCNGLADGAARAFLDGGTAPYRYIWDGGQTSEVISNQPSGTYAVTVLDANNCPNNGSIILIEPPVLEVEANVDIPVSCYEESDAAISLAGTGGAGIYSYAMDGINYQAANQFGGLDFGTKDFYIRDGNGCVQQIQQKVPQPDPISIQFQNVVDALCNDPIGSALAAASGGNGGFSYQWFDELSGADFNTGEMLQGAPASIYRVAVFDSKGCTSSDLVAVSSIGGASFDIDNISAVTCFGFDDGSASISVTSGAMPYSYSWSDGQSSIMASNLVAGSYFATVTDGLGCKTIKPVLIPSPPQLEANYNQKIPNCVGDCDGELEAIATGGTAPYTFNWVSLQTSNALITGLCSGEYDLEVTDANGCKIEELVALSDPEPLAITVNSTRPICLGNCGGAINAIGIGGAGPYLYQWENGPSSALYNDICPGDYAITMTDANGCQTTEVKTLLAGDPLPVDLGEDVTLCVGQTHELDAGEGWITVSWTSTNGFVASDPLVVVSEPGTYTVTATDATGCMGVDDFTLETSLDLLTAEFLVPAETVLGDTLVAVDVSWPLADRVEWKIPASFTRLPTESPNVLFAVPSESGDYIVGMESFLAACRDLAEKQIIILASEKENVGGRLGYKDELVKQFSVFPNPNNGRFDVNLLLSEEREIKLQIISFPKGAIEVYYEGPSSDFHQVNFELTDLAQGMYLVLLTMDQEKRLIRFVKK